MNDNRLRIISVDYLFRNTCLYMQRQAEDSVDGSDFEKKKTSR